MNMDRVNNQRLALATRTLRGLVVGGIALGAGLTLSFARAQAGASPATDAQVQSSVNAALQADAQLRGQQVTATVAQGVVTLSGTVAEDAQRIAAEQTVAQVGGVTSIDDGIAVGGQMVAAGETGVASPPQDGSVAGDPGQQGPAPTLAQGQDQAQDQAQAQTQGQGGVNGMPPPPPSDSAAPPAQQYPQSGLQGGPQGGPQSGGQYGPYSQQPGQYAPYPPQRGQYGQYAPPPQSLPRQPRPYVPGVSPATQNASGPVTLAPGLLLNVRISEPLSTAQHKAGDFVQFTAASDLYSNGVVAVPRGAVLTGQVIESKNAGPFGGSPRLDLKLTTLALGNQTYPITSDVWSSQGPSKSGYTAANTVGGAAFGALIGAVAGGGVGAGIGAIAGGTGGALVSGATHGPRLDLPAEAMLQFHLTAPLTVQPVNYSEAERLAASVPEQPVLRQRPMYVRAPYPYYARPYYAYPAPYYYRPY